MTDITSHLVLFRRYLDASWEAVRALATLSGDPDTYVDDWLQASWELLVEITLEGVTLRSYGGGADVYGESERVTNPETSPSHLVAVLGVAADGAVCEVFSGARMTFGDEGLEIDELVTRNGDHWDRRPPFDHVRCGAHVFAAADVLFFARPIRDDE